MAQADVLALIDDIAGIRSDTVNLAEAAVRLRFYGDVVFENGLQREEGSWDAAYAAVTRGTATYTEPAAAIRTMMLLYDNRELRGATRRGLEAYDANWRSRQGRPRSYTEQDQDYGVMRLVPVPDVDGQTVGAFDPLVDPDFPGNNLTFVYTDNVTDVLAWDEMWVALDVLSREFGRESDHYDTEFAKLARQLAAMIRSMVGYAA